MRVYEHFCRGGEPPAIPRGNFSVSSRRIIQFRITCLSTSIVISLKSQQVMSFSRRSTFVPSKVINLTINSFLNRTVESEITYHISRALIEHLDDEQPRQRTGPWYTGGHITLTSLQVNDVTLKFQQKDGVLIACSYNNQDWMCSGSIWYTDIPTLLRDLEQRVQLSGRVGWNTEQEAALMSVDM